MGFNLLNNSLPFPLRFTSVIFDSIAFGSFMLARSLSSATEMGFNLLNNSLPFPLRFTSVIFDSIAFGSFMLARIGQFLMYKSKQSATEFHLVSFGSISFLPPASLYAAAAL